MKIKLFCQECFQSFVTNSTSIDEAAFREANFFQTAQDITDNNIMEFCCNAGHKNYCFIQNPKYELLYDMGYSAYKDGYYREACLDFAASIERFHEFCLYVMLLQNEHETISNLEKMWAQISKQSERQYGAFIVLYTKVMGGPPRGQVNKYLEFRNNVTHKGTIPSKEETFDYAKYVSDYIGEIYRSLEAKNNMMNAVFATLPALLEYKKPISTQVIPTILSSVCRGQCFEDAIESHENMFALMYGK